MYDEWIEQQGSEAKIAADDSEYGDYPHLEHEVVCLKATAFENCEKCRTGRFCDPFDYETKVACCNGIQTNGNYYYPDDDPEEMTPTPPVVIGSCHTHVMPLVTPITIAPGHKKLATFTKFCSIAHGSLCGAPFCNDLQLVQNGIVMQGLAISKNDPRTNPPAGWSFNQCPVMSGPPNQGTGDSTTNRTVTDPVEIMGAAETEGYGYGGYDGYGGPGGSTPPPPPASPWYKGYVEVYSGPVTIYSKKYHFKYHFGHMEFTMWAGNTTVQATKPKLPEVNPWTYTLKMVKPQGY